MEYTIDKLSRMAGVSARTLRYYDEIGLFQPVRVHENGYRIYESSQLEQLQQILFYRALHVPLKQIKRIVQSPTFDRMAALKEHLARLEHERELLDARIANVKRTIVAEQEGSAVSDEERFVGLKDLWIAKNEARFGSEIRERYGEEQVQAFYEHIKSLLPEDYRKKEDLEEEIKRLLRVAVQTGDPGSTVAQEACNKHRAWLLYTWNNWDAKAYEGLATLYEKDPRFSMYYDAIAPGCTQFFAQAMRIYAKDQSNETGRD